MDTEREIILKYTTKEERAKVRLKTRALAIVIGGTLALFALSQYIVWLFYEFELLDGIWDVVPPGNETPAVLMMISMILGCAITLKWCIWAEPNKDERSIMKERYGVEYDTGKVDDPIEDEE